VPLIDGDSSVDRFWMSFGSTVKIPLNLID
jgi:hypothetical protein